NQAHYHCAIPPSRELVKGKKTAIGHIVRVHAGQVNNARIRRFDTETRLVPYESHACQMPLWISVFRRVGNCTLTNYRNVDAFQRFSARSSPESGDAVGSQALAHPVAYSYILVGIHRTVAYRSGYYPKTDACPFDWELRPTLTERLDVFVTSALRSSANALIMSSQFQNWTSNPEETHGSLMAISLWAMGGVSLLFLVIRCYIRQKQKKFWYDDGVLVVSWFLLLVQIILNQLNINLGFGKHALDINFANFERITYYGASGLTVSIFAIILSKISFGLTLLRLTEGWLKAWVWFAIATLFIFAVPVAIIPWVLCKPITKTFVDILPGECVDKHPSVIYGRFQAGSYAKLPISLHSEHPADME
ncbi:hypothetical protein PtrSN002B_011728, partial [Pyrenophora tritici-repentis]